MIQVLGKRVLVEEVSIKKESKVILLNENDKKETYEVTRKIIGVGDEVEGIKIGDIPCVSVHAKPHYFEVIEYSEDKIVSNLVYYLTDIAGISKE